MKAVCRESKPEHFSHKHGAEEYTAFRFEFHTHRAGAEVEDFFVARYNKVRNHAVAHSNVCCGCQVGFVRGRSPERRRDIYQPLNVYAW